MKRIAFLFLLVPTLAFSENHHRSYSETLLSKGYEVGMETSYFKASRRIDKDGNEKTFSDGEGFNKIDLTVFYKYGFSNAFEMSLDLRTRKNQATFHDGTDLKTGSAFGLESAGISFKYAFPYLRGFQWAFEGNYRNSFYTNETNNTGNSEKLILGEDGQEVSVGTSVTYLSTSKHFISGRVLYRNPDQDLSSEIFSEIEGSLNFSKLSLFAGGEKNISLKGDPYEGSSNPRPAVNTGGSYLFNSTNREWTAVHGGIGFFVAKKYRMELIGKRYIQGLSTDLGDEVLIRLTLVNNQDKSYKKYDREFKEYRIEASVEKVAANDKGVIIDKGLADGVSKGMRFDFYKYDYFGGNVLVATGYATKVNSSKAIVQITTKHTDEKLSKSLVARGGLL